MTERPGPHEAGIDPVAATTRQGFLSRNILGTQWPAGLLLGLIALGLPRTILADLGIIEPQTPVYFVFALTPFGVWLACALVRRTGSPIKDHLVAGSLYGLSLIIVHEALWGVASSQGQHLPQSAITLAERFGPPLRDLVPHLYSTVVAMMIGLGVGIIAAIVAMVANRVRTRRNAARHADAVR